MESSSLLRQSSATTSTEWHSRIRRAGIGLALALFASGAAVFTSTTLKSKSMASRMGLSSVKVRSVGKPQSSETATKPHIFLVTIDDMGFNDIGYQSTDLGYQTTKISGATEFMTKLSEESIILSHHYSQPSCTPSRTTIMSGKWVHKTGFQDLEVEMPLVYGIPTSMQLLPKYMNDLGYRVHGFGKWNVGHCSEQYMPHQRGFHSFLGYTGPGHDYKTWKGHSVLNGTYKENDVVDMFKAVKDVDAEGNMINSIVSPKNYWNIYDTELYSNQSLALLESHAEKYPDQPMFMWYAQHGIHGDGDHTPPNWMLDSHDKKYLKYLERLLAESGEVDDPIFFDKRLNTAKNLLAVDFTVYRLVEKINELGMLDNSVVWVHSDNGGSPTWNKSSAVPGNNWPLRSEKFYYMEGGVRVPSFIYAPGIIDSSLKGKTYRGMLHHVDILPTLVGLGGGNALEVDEKLDGFDMWSYITSGKHDTPRQEILFRMPRSGKDWVFQPGHTAVDPVSLRIGDFKMLITAVWEEAFKPIPGQYTYMTDDCGYDWYSVIGNQTNCGWLNLLFDLKNDPYEDHNLWHHHDYIDVRDFMMKRLNEILQTDDFSYGNAQYHMYEKYQTMGSEYYEQYWTAIEKNDMWITPFGCEVIH